MVFWVFEDPRNFTLDDRPNFSSLQVCDQLRTCLRPDSVVEFGISSTFIPYYFLCSALTLLVGWQKGNRSRYPLRVCIVNVGRIKKQPVNPGLTGKWALKMYFILKIKKRNRPRVILLATVICTF